MIMNKNVGTSCIEEISLFYDGTDTYTTRQRNDYYIYYNVATVGIPKWVSRNDHYIYYNAAMVGIPKWVSSINNYQRMLAQQERGLGGVRTG